MLADFPIVNQSSYCRGPILCKGIVLFFCLKGWIISILKGKDTLDLCNRFVLERLNHPNLELLLVLPFSQMRAFLPFYITCCILVCPQPYFTLMGKFTLVAYKREEEGRKEQQDYVPVQVPDLSGCNVMII